MYISYVVETDNMFQNVIWNMQAKSNTQKYSLPEISVVIQESNFQECSNNNRIIMQGVKDREGNFSHSNTSIYIYLYQS